MTLFNIQDYGAVGDGIVDDWAAIQSALGDAAESGGCLYIPAGTFKITQPLTQHALGERSVSIRGDGPNVSVIVANGIISALDCKFEQDGQTQPWGLNLEGVGFRCVGKAATAITVSYGEPPVTSDHYRPSVIIRNVVVESSPSGSWSNGIDITSAWNVSMSDVFVSGDSCGGNWNAMHGTGIQFNRMCVNAHLVNVRCNFWAVGLGYNALGGPNTEGLFCTNCSMVAVKQGVHIVGNPLAPAPRMSTLTWAGGMIECRVGGVESQSAAFHLDHVWTALITGCQMLAEAIPTDHLTYGVLLENCAGVVVSSCDIDAWRYGLHTAGQCKAISSHGNTYTNCEKQNVFPRGTTGSRSYGHVLFNNAPFDWTETAENKMGFVW